jgi:hypothetical protein
MVRRTSARALARRQEAAGITAGSGLPAQLAPRRACRAPPLPCIGATAPTPWAVAAIVKARAAEAGFGGRYFGGHSLKRAGRAAVELTAVNVLRSRTECSRGTIRRPGEVRLSTP